MEGMFAFFLESTFLGILLYGEKRVSRRAHFGAAVALFLGSWLSGYFITATNAFMQHPVGYVAGRGRPAAARRLLGFVFEPVGVLGVRPRHERGGGDGLLRDGGDLRLLAAPRPAPGGRDARAAHRRDRRVDRHGPPDLPHRRPQREARRRPPAGHPGRHGGALRQRALRQARHHRPAGHEEPAAREPHRGPGAPQLPRLRLLREHGGGAERHPAGPVARQRPARLLRVSRDGGARDGCSSRWPCSRCSRCGGGRSSASAGCSGAGCSPSPSRTSPRPPAG